MKTRLLQQQQPKESVEGALFCWRFVWRKKEKKEAGAAAGEVLEYKAGGL